MLEAGDREAAVKCARDARVLLFRSHSASERFEGQRWAYLLAVEAGDDSLASESASTLVDGVENGDRDAWQSTLGCLEPAIQAGRAEAATMLAALQSKAGKGLALKAPTTTINSPLASSRCNLREEISDRGFRSRGWTRIVRIRKWRQSPGGSGRITRSLEDQITARLSGTPLPQFEGKLGVELLFSEDGASMLPLATLPASGARGSWEGRLPAPAGFVRAVITDATGVYLGSSLPVFAGRNLLRRDGEPGEFWGFPADVAKVLQNGPAAQGSYVRWDYQAPPELGADTTLVGRKIELRPDCDYFLSGWVRAAPRGSQKHANLGWRTYDRAGQRLGEGVIDANPSGIRFWHFQCLRLRRPGNDGESAQLAANAVWLEPIVQDGRGGFDLAGLSLIEIRLPEIIPAAK